MPDLDLLRHLGDQVEPPPFDSLRETARHRDRRTAVAAAALSAVAVVAVTATAVVLGPDEDPRPVEPPRIEEPTTRPLTYADGATVHLGGRTVEAAGPVVELDVTDAGAVFRTVDGRIWFTDGSSTDQIGELGEPGPVYTADTWPPTVHDGWVVSTHTGSVAAWFEFPRVGQGWVVAHDTATGEQLGRARVALDDGGAFPASVTAEAVYWFGDTGPDADAVPDVRFDLASGEQAPVSEGALQDQLRAEGPARTVLIGRNRPEVTDGTDRNFAITKGRVVPQGEQPLVATDGATGRPFEFEAPPGLPATLGVWLTQWLDDTSVTLVAQLPEGDQVLGCRTDTGACEVLLSGPSRLVFPELG